VFRVANLQASRGVGDEQVYLLEKMHYCDCATKGEAHGEVAHRILTPFPVPVPRVAVRTHFRHFARSWPRGEQQGGKEKNREGREGAVQGASVRGRAFSVHILCFKTSKRASSPHPL